MHEPARRRGFAAVKSFAVEPEAAAFAVFDEIVVAARRKIAVVPVAKPPLGRDPFRTLRAGDIVSQPAPGKTPRRPVGNERRDLGRLGTRQKKKRACLLRFRLGQRRHALDRRQHFGAFGNMTRDGFELPHAMWTEPLLQ